MARRPHVLTLAGLAAGLLRGGSAAGIVEYSLITAGKRCSNAGRSFGITDSPQACADLVCSDAECGNMFEDRAGNGELECACLTPDQACIEVDDFGANRYELSNPDACATETHGDCFASLFEHRDFSGLSASFSLGSFTRDDIIANGGVDDGTSSIFVSGEGCVATVYQNADLTGWSASFTDGSYSLDEFVAAGAVEDEVSAVVVHFGAGEADDVVDEAAAAVETHEVKAPSPPPPPPHPETPHQSLTAAEEKRLASDTAAKADNKRLAAEAMAKADNKRLNAEAAAKAHNKRVAAEAAAKADNKRLAAGAAAIGSAAAKEPYRVRFGVSSLDGVWDHRGSFVMEVHPAWAPLGAARFKELVDINFFKAVGFFRVIKGFMAQFGISGKPDLAAEWKEKKLQDDPVKESNVRGFVSFATSGKGSRTTQMFINCGDNKNLDGMDFAPFAKVVEGMDVVDRIYNVGEEPSQGEIQSSGNFYLKKNFPLLSYITKTTLLAKDEL